MKQYLLEQGCPCGKCHKAEVKEVVTGSGAVGKLPALVREYGAKKPFLLADVNTWQAAGAQVAALFQRESIAFNSYVFPQKKLEPDEQAVGGMVMRYDSSCDLIVAIGSGVLNDLGKILSVTAGKPYFIVATAPSMDGYASATSSMARDGVKVSLNTRCADVIVGDTDILKNAPLHMLKSGLGDMLAKFVSIAEWRIAHIITGEYYCGEVAGLIRSAVKKCTDHAQGLLNREESAVEAVFEGLVIGGLAMAYAGVSRPASGVEHYFSHVWDMRALEFGLDADLHGIQCAVGTLLAAKLYDRIRTVTPDAEKAAASVAAFDYEAWKAQLRVFLGTGGEEMIALEAREGKYDKAKHPARFAVIAENWQKIQAILQEELPTAKQLAQLLDTLQIEKDPAAYGIDRACLQQTFRATKDIRDKYVLSRLAWDLGVLEELCGLL